MKHIAYIATILMALVVVGCGSKTDSNNAEAADEDNCGVESVTKTPKPFVEIPRVFKGIELGMSPQEVEAAFSTLGKSTENHEVGEYPTRDNLYLYRGYKGKDWWPLNTERNVTKSIVYDANMPTFYSIRPSYDNMEDYISFRADIYNDKVFRISFGFKGDSETIDGIRKSIIEKYPMDVSTKEYDVYYPGSRALGHKKVNTYEYDNGVTTIIVNDESNNVVYYDTKLRQEVETFVKNEKAKYDNSKQEEIKRKAQNY